MRRIPMSPEGRRRAAVRQARMAKLGKFSVLAMCVLCVVLLAIQL